MTQRRFLTPKELLAWAAEDAPMVRLRTGEDALPGGWSASMSPLLVNWRVSQLNPDGFYVVRNLNLGGNPVEGTTNLCAARVEANSVAAAEFVLVPLDPLGRWGIVAHAMLRFVFKQGAEMRLLGGAGVESGGIDRVPDLVLSWEAWRPPGEDFDALRGLDPDTFGLTLRGYSGGQRFLEDGLRGRDWHAYTLQLPGGVMGLNELLRVSLVLGDSVARKSLEKLLLREENGWEHNMPPGDEADQQQTEKWETLRRALVDNGAPDDPLQALQQPDIGYQTLERSCATLALFTIDATVERLRAAGLDGNKNRARLKLAPQKMEKWMEDIAHSNLLGIFLRAPTALWWLVRHQHVLPNSMPDLLQQSGLLELSDKKVVERSYRLHGQTPYGNLKDHLPL